ncbi:hypothetical protein [Ostreiculturibacter nitratireducens]|uniref:hypothetical protein n=1 Tax=Ostreiculturibacter nitratireducens TaxID=3075226 RepID=UPI0031B64017
MALKENTVMSESILVVGMSHVEAIDRALDDADRRQIRVLALNREPGIFDVKANRLDLSAITGCCPKVVCLSLGGNFHNIFGLLELPQPIRIGDPTLGSVPAPPKRLFVPHDLMRLHFERRIDRLLSHAEAIHEHFCEARFFYLCAPPPIADETHLARHPGVFRSRLHMGFAPHDLRVALHRLQRDIYAARAARNGAVFLDPPMQACDAGGFLGRDYWANDPTHGNAAYGRLVVDQIRAREALAA